MGDTEDGRYGRWGSRSPSKLDNGSPARVKSESRSSSLSPSWASKHSESRSRSRSKSRSRTRQHLSRRSSRSCSRSGSHRRKSRSRSYSPECHRRRSQSMSPMSNRRHHTGNRQQSHDFTKEAYSHGHGADVRAHPDPSTRLGVCGLSLYTTERDLKEVFSRYGPLAGVSVVYDQRTGRSRGFAFVYFESLDDSKEAMEQANGMELDGRRISVDYSTTKRPHTPTPGVYMGRPTYNGGGSGSSRRGRVSHSDSGYDEYDEYDFSRMRSPSPYYRRYRSRSRYYSPLGRY